MARPSSYKEEYDQQAYKLTLLGATDKELGDFFGVLEQTINNWKKAHPSFFESLKKGKKVADANVAESLYHKACGFYKPHVKIFQFKGEPVIVDYQEYYPPDTAAAFIWLKNRAKEHWRDKQEVDLSISEYSQIIDDVDVDTQAE